MIKFVPENYSDKVMYKEIVIMCLISLGTRSSKYKNDLIIKRAKKLIRSTKDKRIKRSMKQIIKHGDVRSDIVFALDNIHKGYAMDLGRKCEVKENPYRHNGGLVKKGIDMLMLADAFDTARNKALARKKVCIST